MEQNQEMKLLLKQNSKALEFCLRGTWTLLRKKNARVLNNHYDVIRPHVLKRRKERERKR